MTENSLKGVNKKTTVPNKRATIPLLNLPIAAKDSNQHKYAMAEATQKTSIPMPKKSAAQPNGHTTAESTNAAERDIAEAPNITSIPPIVRLPKLMTLHVYCSEEQRG